MANPTGRQPRLTNRVAHELCFLVSHGVSLRQAAAGLEIPYDTVFTWLKAARRAGPNERPFSEFGDDLACARAERAAEVAELLAHAHERAISYASRCHSRLSH